MTARETLKDLVRRLRYTAEFEDVEMRDVNQVGIGGETLLHAAARNGDIETMRLLLSLGADANRPGDLGDTPLHSAVSSKKPEAIRMLIEHGADTTIRNELGRTARETAVLMKRDHLLDAFDAA